MNKEEFIEKKDLLEGKINELKDKITEYRSQLIKAGQEYINTNQPYPVGTKLKVTFPKRSWEVSPKVVVGIVKDYFLAHDIVRPRLAKVKKDGTAHKTAEEYVDWWEKPVVEVVTD